MSSPNMKSKAQSKKAKQPQPSKLRDMPVKKDVRGGTSFSYTKPDITYEPQK